MKVLVDEGRTLKTSVVEMEVPLSLLSEGQKGKISRLLGGYGLLRRLLDLGLSPGTEIVVIRNQGGPVIISYRGARVALGRGITNKILVEVR